MKWKTLTVPEASKEVQEMKERFISVLMDSTTVVELNIFNIIQPAYMERG